MERNATPRIVTVERLREGVVVKFTDGSCAFYSARLLYQLLTQAEPQNEKSTGW